MLRFILFTALYMFGTWYAVTFIGGPSQVAAQPQGRLTTGTETCP